MSSLHLVILAMHDSIYGDEISTIWQSRMERFRNDYFAGDRLAPAVTRVARIKSSLGEVARSMPETSLGFALAHPAVSTVIAGTRNSQQAAANAAVSDMPSLDERTLKALHAHHWRRAFWSGGK